MTTYPMCPRCHVADFRVEMARDVRGDCPHCGTALWESQRVCCVPKCSTPVPVTKDIPVCTPCGVKIALAHLHDAMRYDAVHAEVRRRREELEDARRNGRSANSVVYYVRLDEARIKIGFTADLRGRLRAFRVHPSALLAIEPGGRDVEKARHEQFANIRLDTRLEEFAPTAELLAWAAGLREANDVPHWAKVPDTRVVRKSA